MELGHHQALLAAYATAMIGWLLVRRRLPAVWPPPEPVVFARPWRELGWAFVAVAGVLGVGQLVTRGWLLPTDGPFGLLLDALNQVLLYGPMVLLLVLRRQPLSSAWLPTGHVPLRVAVGLGLALAALTAFAVTRLSLGQWPALLAFVYGPAHAPLLVHVLLEDLTIAILFVRFAAVVRRPMLVAVVVAALFAAGHAPGMLARGAGLTELVPLLLDFALGIGVLAVVQRSADIWWFWCVHFALDMTQWFPGAGA